MPNEFVLDRAGGPMIWVEAIQAYLHAVPVTKLQFERFLCDQPGGHFDQKWYDAVLGLDPDRTGRVSPYALKGSNYWQAFLTGIRPDEARVYAQWCEEEGANEYAIPTQTEWFAVYEALKKEEVRPDLFAERGLTPRMTELLQRLEEIGGKFPAHDAAGRTLAEQLYLRNGVLEWVACKQPGKPEWGGLGQPGSSFLGTMFNLDRGVPNYQRDALTTRISGYGFRLIRRAG